MPFEKAVRRGQFLRFCLAGPSGSGKTWTSLLIASQFEGPIAQIDTEHGSGSLYADDFSYSSQQLRTFSPQAHIAVIHEAQAAGFKVLILDSGSHEWMGPGGMLESVDDITTKSKSGNAFTTGWRQMTPQHNQFIDAILSAQMHVIVCLREKEGYVQEMKDGKTYPRKIGLEPVQRDGITYEFTVFAEMNAQHELAIGKTRCRLIDGKRYQTEDSIKEMAGVLRDWLGGAAPEVLTHWARGMEKPLMQWATSQGFKGELKDLLAVIQASEPGGKTIQVLTDTSLTREEIKAAVVACVEKQKKGEQK